MAPIVKDVENSAATTPPAAPATKPAQPVALEVPVTVNGARTVDGSDKREPFSESTKTVLIFGHGAVIRLASRFRQDNCCSSPTKKQRRKLSARLSNRRTTAPSPAMSNWNLPSPRLVSGACVFPPIAFRPLPLLPPVLLPLLLMHPRNILRRLPALPKIAAVPPAPAALKPPAPAPVPVKPVATAPSAAPPVAKAIPPKPQQPVASHPVSPVLSHPAPSVPPVPPVFAHTSLRNLQCLSRRNLLTFQKPFLFQSRAISSANLETKPVAPQPTKTVPPVPSADSTTDELKQHTARLQEQLSSMLFSEAPTAERPVPEKPAAPQPDIIPTETVQKILQLAQTEVKAPAPPIVPSPEIKSTPASVKSAPVSMAVEEVKIPAWLAPLARETDANPDNTTVEDAVLAEARSSPASSRRDEALSSDTAVASAKIQHPMFGDQLLGTSPAVAAASSSGGSKKGLFIGLAAAGLLVIGGGVGTRSSRATPSPVSRRQSQRPCRRRPRRIHLRQQAISQPSGQKPRRQAPQLEMRKKPPSRSLPRPFQRRARR